MMCDDINIGDIVKPINYYSDFTYKVIAIYRNELWLEFSKDGYTNNGIYKKSEFIKKEGNKFTYTYDDRILCCEFCPRMRR